MFWQLRDQTGKDNPWCTTEFTELRVGTIISLRSQNMTKPTNVCQVYVTTVCS